MQIVRDILNTPPSKPLDAYTSTPRSGKHEDHKPIDFTKSRTLLENFCATHNEKVDTKYLKLQHVNFLMKLVGVLGTQIKLKANTRGAVLSHESTYLISNTRRYYANVKDENDQFSASVTVRTVANWLDRLEEVGLIKRTNTGRAQVTIAINPAVLKINDGFEIIRQQLLTIFDKNAAAIEKYNLLEMNEVRNEHRKNFHTNTSTGNNKNIITTEVDLLNTVKQDEYLANLFLLEAPKNQTQDEGLKTGSHTPGPQTAPDNRLKRNTFINNTVIYLYLWILQNLYQDRHLSQSQHQNIVSYFIADADRQQSSYLTEKYADHTMKRLRKWRDFVGRDTQKRFTPLPSQFFNDDMPQGFIKTMSWLQKDAQSTQKLKMEQHIQGFARRACLIINPNATANAKHLKPTWPLNMLLTELGKIDDQVMRYTSKHQRPDLYAKYIKIVNQEFEKVDYGNQA